MRMWNLDVKEMCDRHLLGEHVELHMFDGTLNKGKSIQGYVDKGLVEVHNIKKRHDKIATEMLERGFQHNSPLKTIRKKKIGKVVVEKSKREILKRCESCNIKQKKGG